MLPVCRHYDPLAPRGCRLERLVPRDCRACTAHNTDREAEQDPRSTRKQHWMDEHDPRARF
jgi:hypothetical protein